MSANQHVRVPLGEQARVTKLDQFKEVCRKYRVNTRIHKDPEDFNRWRSHLSAIICLNETDEHGKLYGPWNNISSVRKAKMISDLLGKHPWMRQFEDCWGSEVALRLVYTYRRLNGRRTSKSKRRKATSKPDGQYSIHNLISVFPLTNFSGMWPVHLYPVMP